MLACRPVIATHMVVNEIKTHTHTHTHVRIQYQTQARAGTHAHARADEETHARARETNPDHDGRSHNTTDRPMQTDACDSGEFTEQGPRLTPNPKPPSLPPKPPDLSARTPGGGLPDRDGAKHAAAKAVRGRVETGDLGWRNRFGA